MNANQYLNSKRSKTTKLDTSDKAVATPVSEGTGSAVVDGVVEVGEFIISSVTDNVVVGFLGEKFGIIGKVAVDLASALPKTVINKIEEFDGEGLSKIAEGVADTIKSIELPDIDFPDINF